jgi:hypothetical protein
MPSGLESIASLASASASRRADQVPRDSAGAESVPQARPLLTVVRGEPTVAELGALTVVIGALARRAGERPAAKPARSQWAARDRMLRQPLAGERGAWRARALPQR